MASIELPSDYDAIILGSGMTECIIAAALSRIGYNVLHMDRNDYYSGDWACFNWKGLQEWITTKQNSETGRIIPKEVDIKQMLKVGETVEELQVNSSAVSNVEQVMYVSDKPSKPETLSEKTANLHVGGSEETFQPSFSEHEQEEGCTPANTVSTETKAVEVVEGQAVKHEQVNSDTSTKPADDTSGSTQTDKHSTESSTVQDSTPAESSQSTSNEENSNCFSTENEEKQYYTEDISSQWRKFNIDLMPKVLYCRGPMVELLISSDVAKYCEFKTISRVLTYINDHLEPVPCSRADVFSSKQVSMIEKRMMMKFLQFCINYSSQPQEYEGCEEMPFCEFLKNKKLSANVCHYIQHSIAMVKDTASTLEGLESSQRFIQALGRYGNTAFLWPVYGSGELPQCFCRMCAVFGGCYCLRRTGTHFVVDGDNKCTGIIDTEGQKLNCKWLILESSYAPPKYKETATIPKIARAIFITTHSILHRPDQEDITQMSFARAGDKTPITVYEVGPSAYACPKDMFIVHLTCECAEGAKKDFEDVVSKLFVPLNCDAEHEGEEDKRPKILWQLYYEVENTNRLEYPDCPEGVYLVSGPDSKMDFESSIKKAKEIFTSLCPGEEFLPKAPNPEDIIWNEDDPNKETKESGFETESSTEKETNSSVLETGSHVENDTKKPDSADEKVRYPDSTEPGPEMVAENKDTEPETLTGEPRVSDSTAEIKSENVKTNDTVE